jgi:hypothetical protein
MADSSPERKLPWYRRHWKRRLVTLACVEVFINVFGCANTFLLHPSTAPRNPVDAVARTVDLNGKSVEVWTSSSPACDGHPPRAFVLEFCGNGTRAEEITSWIAKVRWKRWPVQVWVMNYPGYGKSDGPAHLRDIPPAALATFDALHGLAGSKPIFLEANSLGTSVALYVASRRATAGLILTNPPPLRRLIIQKHGWWNLWLLATPIAYQVPAELNAPDTAPHVTEAACFLLSDEDAIVPPQYHQIVVDAYTGPKTIINIPGVGHNDPVADESEAKLADWIERQWVAKVPTTQTACVN